MVELDCRSNIILSKETLSFLFFPSFSNFDLDCSHTEIIMKYIVFAQVLSLVLLVALAFPQNDRSSEISGNTNNPTTSTTQATTTNCPCVATAEYNPVCGTDNITYWNMGRFNCAKKCNPGLEVRIIRACEPYSQLSSN